VAVFTSAVIIQFICFDLLLQDACIIFIHANKADGTFLVFSDDLNPTMPPDLCHAIRWHWLLLGATGEPVGGSFGLRALAAAPDACLQH
jgi:hypothetical protein